LEGALQGDEEGMQLVLLDALVQDVLEIPTLR